VLHDVHGAAMRQVTAPTTAARVIETLGNTQDVKGP